MGVPFLIRKTLTSTAKEVACDIVMRQAGQAAYRIIETALFQPFAILVQESLESTRASLVSTDMKKKAGCHDQDSG